MTLQTDLSRSPYFDDYNPKSSYYRVLWKPGSSVQTRELNQIQSIFQNQIEQFGKSIYQEGSVIEGCTFSFDNKKDYVKISDNYANNFAFTISDFKNQYVYNNNGLKAYIVDTIGGHLSDYATGNTNTLYIKYLNTVPYSNGVVQQKFDPNDNLVITSSANIAIGNVTVANSLTTPTGYGYSMTTTEGIIFKKGTFLYVTPQTLIVTPYTNIPDQLSVGFDAIETIDNAVANNSLYDNAAGSPNYLAPGADRLKIYPTLVTRATPDIANNNSFFSIADFKNGAVVTLRQNAQYAALGAEMARRTFETNGDFVINPFILNTSNKANTSDPLYANNVNLLISQGLGYVEGYRVEYINNSIVNLRKGTDYKSVSQQKVSLNFGYYALVNCVAGEFGSSSSVIQVDLYNTALNAVSSGNLLSVSPSAGNKIGTAYVKGFAYSGMGTPGTAAAQYELYIFNIVMNGGYRFQDVRNITYNVSGSPVGIADVVLQYNATAAANGAVIQAPDNPGLIYPFGQKAIVTNSFVNQSFVYRRKTSATFATSGIATANVSSSGAGAAVESFPYLGLLSPTQEQDFHIVATSTAKTANLTGNVAVTASNATVTGVSGPTTFLTTFQPGDYITINHTSPQTVQIVSIANNISMTVTPVISATNTGVSFTKTLPAGSVIPFSNRSDRTINVASQQAILTIGDMTLTGSFTADIFYSVNRSTTSNTSPTISVKKVLNRNVYVKIDCSNNSGGVSGPWSLGVPDVLSIDGVYIGSGHTYSNTGVDYSSNFTLDNGQRDAHYDIAKMSINTSTAGGILSNTSTILVKMSLFTYNTSQGVGFFAGDSYPVDDVHGAANTNAIVTAQIPVYTNSKGNVFDLRDSIDFRPYATNTAVANATTVAGATINPSSTLTFSEAPYLPTPDSTFQTDLSYYLKRIDRVMMNTAGSVIVGEGIPDAVNPIAPNERSGMMTLGFVSIPPYPSLSTDDAKTYKKFDYAITSTLLQNKRYTMKDIKKIEKRIDNIEYYTSLSLLEQSAASLQTRSATTGQNRFQNGIYVESFKDFSRSNTLDPKYYIGLDTISGEARPAYTQFKSNFKFNQALSTGVVKHGELIMLEHTSNNVYISQGYGSRYRSCVDGNIYTYKGNIDLTPTGTDSPDTTKAPDIVNNLDLASNFINLQNAWGTQWGNWVAADATTSNTLITASSSTTVTNNDNSKDTTTNTQTLAETTTNISRIGTTLNNTVSDANLNLGTFVNNISILPYLKAATIRFKVSGMKPNTVLYAYFSNVPMSTHCAQYIKDLTVPNSPGIGDARIMAYFGEDNGYPYGTWQYTGSGQTVYGYMTTANQDSFGNVYACKTDSKGTAQGIFSIPDNTFKAEENVFMLTDIYSLEQGENAKTTEASATFYGSKLAFSTQTTILSTRQTVLKSTEVTDTATVSGLAVVDQTTKSHTAPPPVNHGDSCGCNCIICTKLYQMGLMDEDTFLADQMFGEALRSTDPEVYDGYIRWAKHVVNWLSGDTPNVMIWIRDLEKRRKRELELTTKITHRIATPWAQHMQYLMGMREKDNFAGKMIMAVGRPISKLVAKLPRSKPLAEENISRFTSCAMIGLFFVLYSISKVFGGRFGFPETINI